MKVAIALSGGVDSAVAAHLLKQQGYDVFALFMKNWEEKTPSNRCSAERDFRDIIDICQLLNIPYYAVNFSKLYWERVFEEFLAGIKRGFTPNPDVLCNREIKFSVLYDRARELGADYLATGHYCRTKNGLLFKGKDLAKDQSYFLHAVKPAVFKRVLFPLGELTKKEVRSIAQDIGLSVSDKKESMGICFIGKRRFQPFLARYLAAQKGVIETVDGHMIGTHVGAIYYTIGQRKGLGIGGPGEAYFVVDKDIERNVVVVAQGPNHPALFAEALVANDVSWIASPPMLPLRCSAKIRYRQADQPCRVEAAPNGAVRVIFDKPQRAITRAQSVVFYRRETCLGGGVIVEIDSPAHACAGASKNTSLITTQNKAQ
ncbi:MAG: tRNA 2-thiouridine(34) synthase MnmA [Chlamydiota bacterium]